MGRDREGWGRMGKDGEGWGEEGRTVEYNEGKTEGKKEKEGQEGGSQREGEFFVQMIKRKFWFI